MNPGIIVEMVSVDAQAKESAQTDAARKTLRKTGEDTQAFVERPARLPGEFGSLRAEVRRCT